MHKPGSVLPFFGVDFIRIPGIFKEILRSSAMGVSRPLIPDNRAADAIAIIQDGRVRALGTPAELIGGVSAATVTSFEPGTPIDLEALRQIDGVATVPRLDKLGWVPDLVVIKLGTNDHSTDPQPSADIFIRGVHGLITQVNTAYGHLPIILLADSSLPQLASRMQTAMQQQRNMGNDQVHFVQVTHPPQSQLGCDWHPLVSGHQAMATELVAAIKPILNW